MIFLNEANQTFVDGKGDAAQLVLVEGAIRARERMATRGELVVAECKQRGLRFLPLQVMRPIYAAAGVLEAGTKRNPVLKKRPIDVLNINPSI